MLLQFMARTGALEEGRGRNRQTVAPGDPQDRWPEAHGLKIFEPRKAEKQISYALLGRRHACGDPQNRGNTPSGGPLCAPTREALNPTAGENAGGGRNRTR